VGPIEARTVVDAPRERVFEYVGDLANRPAFLDHMFAEFHLERLDSSGVGAAARFRSRAPLNGIWIETVIEDSDPPHVLRERGRGGRQDRIPTATTWELITGAGSLTEVRVSFETHPEHPLDRLREVLGAGLWYRRGWARAMRRLREALEADRPPARLVAAGGDRVPGAG
jgi:uncharacterized protein YndB with AHSA1/START domain